MTRHCKSFIFTRKPVKLKLGDVQGAVLNSSDRGGIRIQYSRNPFGKKRDYDGSFINTPTAATYTAPAYEQSAIAPPTYGSGGATAAAYSSGDYSAPATAAAAPGTEKTNGAAAGYEAQPGKLKLPVYSYAVPNRTSFFGLQALLHVFKRYFMVAFADGHDVLCKSCVASFCALCRGTRRLMSQEALNPADNRKVQCLTSALLFTSS